MAGLRAYASLIKLSHSVFALPFALLALLVAAAGLPPPRLLALVVLAVLAARTSAMAYNRFVDRDVDARNPRTAGREIPRGAIRPGAALALTVAAGAVFLLACWLLAPVCLVLGVPVWLWLLGYSHTKRFTALCHLWLGVGLGLAPVAAWVAVRGELTGDLWQPALLGLAVTCWVAGFDTLYSCLDEAFDRSAGLRSLPVLLGGRAALAVARGLHAAAAVLFVAFGVGAGLGAAYHAGVVLAVGLLVWQHVRLRPAGLRDISPALFTQNGVLSVVMLLAGGLDVFLSA